MRIQALLVPIMVVSLVTSQGYGAAFAQAPAQQPAPQTAQQPAPAPAAQQQAPPVSASAAPSAQPSDLVNLPQDIKCFLATKEIGIEGGTRVSGSVDSVTCAVSGGQNKDLPLASHEIKDGIITTLSFGELGVSPAGPFQLAIAIHADKIQALREFLGSSTHEPTALAPALAPAPAQAPPAAPAAAPAVPAGMVLLAEGTEVFLEFDEDLSSKTAHDGDQVEFVLADDLMAGNVIVARRGARAIGEVSNAEKSGMLGKGGDLSIRIDHLRVGGYKVHLRGSKGASGKDSVGGTIGLMMICAVCGILHHGKEVKIQKGQKLTVYVSDDIKLPPAA